MWHKLIARFGCAADKSVATGGQELTSKAESWIAQGRQAELIGQLEAACDYYQRAITAEPDYPGGYLNLGIVLAARGMHADAQLAYEQALNLDTKNAYAQYNLGHLAFTQGEFLEAECWLRAALENKPEFPEAHVVLADTLEALGQDEAALDELALALQQPDVHPGTYFNYALLAIKLRRHEDSEDAIRSFLAVEPGHLGAMQILSNALWGQGLCTESLECLAAIKSQLPNALEIESRILFLLNVDHSISAEELFQRHCEFGKEIEEVVPRRFYWPQDVRMPGRPLHIGYISGDYNWHPVAMFMIPVLERHNRDQFTIYCYSTGSKSDDITKKISSLPDHWINSAELSETELADKINQDRIDILVDLGGLTANSRLTVFAQQPAPVQVSWMGYLNTTGLTRMHYRLCDERTDPLDIADALHTEKLVRLPFSQWCYRPFISVAAAKQPPWELNDFITFGSYNHVLKISPAVCAVWADILKQVPGSRLLCVGLSSTRKMSELLSELTMSGVDSERIQFIARTSLDQYYGWFSEADIALDTFPYGGGTTTFDALWMGVPVVAAKGSTPTSRSAASILEALGLDEWVAPSIDDYVRVAVERANDREQIAALRRTLRPRLQASPLMDEERFVRDLETAYREMWREWCTTAQPPSSAD